MDHRVTQCPRCGTSFRVTEAHLAVAAGAVRCGSCLHIFNAREHWSDIPDPETAAPHPRETEPEPDLDIEIDDDLLIDDDTPLFSDEPPPERRAGISIVDDDFSSLEMAAAGRIRQGDALLDLNDWEQQSNSLFRTLGEEAGDDSDGDDERWAQHLLAEAEREEPVLGAMAQAADDDVSDVFSSPPGARDELVIDLSPEFLEIPSARPPADAADAATAEPVATMPEQAQRPVAPEPAAAALSMRADDRIGDTAATVLFDDFDTEPLQLRPFVREPLWPKVLWGAGLALALALLAAQYLYFNFDTLARGPLRPQLAQWCLAFDCRLPAQSDVARIRTGSLIVRSHPTAPGALAVDAIITNQAEFPQPFPELQLQFTDLDGAPVAGRRFRPEEYLGGELTGSRLMPVQQPVHIALELVDPGPRAVNYLLTVVPGDSARAAQAGAADTALN